MLATLVAAILTQASPETLTYSTVAKPVGGVILDLNKALHRDLRVDEQIAGQPIIVSVSDVPAQALLDRIAKVCYGKWTKDGGLDTLVPDSSAEAAGDLAYRSRRETEIAGRLAQAQREAPASDYTADRADRAIQNLQGLSEQPPKVPPLWRLNNVQFDSAVNDLPVNRLLVQCASQIGARALSQVNGEVVFSSLPNSLQRQLPGPIENYLNEYVAGVIVWNQAVGKQVDATVGQILSEQEPTLTNTDQISKINLIVRTDYSGFSRNGPLSLSLEVIGKPGVILGGNAIELDMRPSGESVKPDSFRIPLSDEARAIRRQSQKGAQPLPQELAAKLKRPDIYDPLSWDSSELLQGLANRKKEQLVAVLPDGNFFGNDQTAEDVQYTLANENRLNAIEEGGASSWLLISPESPDSLHALRADRRELAQLLIQESSGELPFEARCAYHSANLYREDSLNWSLDALQIRRDPHPDYLAFIGMLAGGVMEDLKKGATVTVGQIPQAAHELLSRLIYDQDLINASEAQTGGRLPEPTEQLPDGLPADSKIVLADEATQQVFANDSKGEWLPATFTTLALIKRELADHALPARFDDFRLGSTETLRFKFDFGTVGSAEIAMIAARSHDDQKYTFETLPDQLKEKIEAAEAAAKSSPSGG